jgi:hypothetical protein
LADWIHGLGTREREVRLALAHTEGHLLVVGTTGAGKTRLFDLLVTQAALRGEAVVVIDPKGDQDLRNAAERACVLAGDPGRFVYFHPAFAQDSARIDPLHSFNRATEVASRVAALIPGETGNDPFNAFGQMAMSNVVQGLLAVGERPSLVALRVLDAETQQYVTDSLPKTRLKSLLLTQGSTTHSQNPLLYTGNVGERLGEEEGDLFPPALLGQLPNLHYLAILAGGRIVKGRPPILGTPKGRG